VIRPLPVIGLAAPAHGSAGGGVTTLNARVAVAAFPAASVARTWKTYEPSSSGADGE
jgi:hypothetical protein